MAEDMTIVRSDDLCKSAVSVERSLLQLAWTAAFCNEAVDTATALPEKRCTHWPNSFLYLG